MTPTLIVLVLVALGVGIVVWATHRKRGVTRTGSQDADTAWNDPLTPAGRARRTGRRITFARMAWPHRGPRS